MDRTETGPSLPALPTEASADALAARPSRRRWRRWLLLLLLVLMGAGLLRGCVMDAFVIRSGSMAPLFEGTPEGGDHLLVLRSSADPRSLQRWDAVILDASVDPDLPPQYGALLKRVVGLGGESLQLRGGDVWASPDETAPPTLVRKPDELIEQLLVPVHAAAGLAAPWTWDGPGTRTELPGGGVRLTAGEPGGQASYTASIDDGLPGEPGENAVGDTALSVEVGACDAVLELRLREGADVFRARLAPAARGGAALYYNVDGRVVAAAQDFAGLRAGDRVLAWNVDGGVRVLVNGRVLLAWDQPPHEPASAPRNDPSLVVEGGSVELRRVVVLRDLYYGSAGPYASGGGAIRIPPGQILVLGDNSPRSRDSRWFGTLPESGVLGRPVAIYRPWARAGWLDRRGCRP